MPTYIFKDTRTNVKFEKYLGMSELDDFKLQNKHLQQVPTGLNVVGGVGDIKIDDGFKSILNNIRENNPGSTMRKY
jgi:hypothetical protein